MPSPDKEVLRLSILLAIGVITLPPMRPLGPLATELAIMIIGFSYIMMVYCLYSATWSVNGGRVPRSAYGRRLSPLEPLRPSRLLDTLLPGHRSQKVTLWEAMPVLGAVPGVVKAKLPATVVVPPLKVDEASVCP